MEPTAVMQDVVSNGGGIPFLTLLFLVPLIGMTVILFIPRGKTEAIKTVAAVATGVPLLLAGYLWVSFEYSDTAMQWVEKCLWIDYFNIEYHVGIDGLSIPLVFLTVLLLFIAVFSSWNVEKTRGGAKGYFMLLLLLEVGIVGVFISLDFFLFYVFWEIMLLPMYFLIGIWGGPRREYAAIKFFLYTLVGSVLMLVAMIAIFLASPPELVAQIEKQQLVEEGKLQEAEEIEPHHTFNIVILTELAREKDPETGENLNLLTGENLGVKGAILGLPFLRWIWLFFFIGFAIKVPVFPFHTWLPDAHVEAPTAISVILAGILLKLGAYGILRINFCMLPEETKYFAHFMAVLGMINIVYGAFVAMAQTDFKKLVAYSSVSHMGYVLLGAAAFTEAGIIGANLQIFNHGTSSAMLFLLVGVVYDRAHHRDLNGFGGLGSKMPVYTGLMTVGVFASMGLPGLAGFVGEALSLLGAWEVYPVYVLISLSGLIVTAAFFLWTIQRVFLGPLNEKYKAIQDVDGREIFCLVPLAFLCVLLGIFPFLLIDWMYPALKNIIDNLM